MRAIGRDPELDAIRRFLAAPALEPSALSVLGEAGIGKTTLWTETLAEARARAFTVMSCRGAESELTLPYAALDDLFTAVPDALIGELPPPQQNALKVALLRVEDEGRPLQQRAVAAGVSNVINAFARTAPLLLAVDDVQWLDAASRRVLAFALRRLGDAPLRVLVAVRTGAGDDDPLGLVDALGSDRVGRLPVGPLDLESLERLLRVRLGHAFPGPLLRRIAQTSGGNPFFALELGVVLRDADTVPAVGDPLPAPASLRELLAARLGRLSRVEADALLTVALLARPTLALVCAASPDGERVTAALERLAAAGVVDIADGSVSFTHPLLASVVHSRSSPADRRRLHARLATAVVNPEERARHLARSTIGPDAAVAAALDDAGRRAASRGAPDAAADLLEEAARRMPAGAADTILRCRIDAADEHVAAGDTARAHLLLDEVTALAPHGPTRARALHRLGRLEVLEAAFSAAPPILQEALDEVGTDAALRAAIERDMVLVLVQTGAPALAVEHAKAGLAAAEVSGQETPIAEALDHLCFAEFSLRGRVAPALLERALALDARVGPAPLLEHPGMTTGRFPLAATLKWMDRFGQARALLRSVYREHVEHGNEGSLPPVLFHWGELEGWAGDCRAAADLAREGHEVARRTGQAVAERLALTVDANVYACLGEAEPARTSARAALDAAHDAGDVAFAIRNLRVLGFVELSLGHSEEAVEHLERGAGLEADAGYAPALLRMRPDLVEALLAVGRADDAARLVADWDVSPGRHGPSWAFATHERCRGLIAAASGELPGAQQLLERALAAQAELPQPFERARTLLALGVVQRRIKQKSQARASIGRARRLFEELGARLWVDRADAELRRIGGRAPRPDALTPAEERVAALVAEGYTNREIAGSLFMSVKTVEANLTHIYRKLDMRSRRDLARWVRSGKARESPRFEADGAGRSLS